MMMALLLLALQAIGVHSHSEGQAIAAADAGFLSQITPSESPDDDGDWLT
jgi:hypothetical protein